MQKKRIWTNPSHQRSLIRPTVLKSEIKNYLSLSIKGDLLKNIMIFPDMEYSFIFYDAERGVKRSVIGMVIDVYSDQIKIKCAKEEKGNASESQHALPPMPVCECILNPPDMSKYNDLQVYFIPIANIIDVSYVMSTPQKEESV